MAISEKEDEIAWQTVARSQVAEVRYAFQSDRISYEGNIDSVKTSTTSCTNKSIQYLAFDPSPTAASPIGAPRIAPIPVLDGCNESHSMYGGAISPTRLPGVPPSVPGERRPHARATPIRPRTTH